ncbi:MAG TPA: hypothetical protein ENJ42_04335, partial [Hellea balneolensis]|nr:hypothetical protein [Hellea balneolensis]
TPGENAHWVLDLEHSKLTSRARAKQRSVQISDIKTRLANPMTAPKTVRIIAHGPNKTALRALSAQGVALRTPNLPAFVVGNSRADFEIVFARFDELPQLATSLPPIAPTSGPVIIADGIQKPRLIMSAADDDGLLELARAFASHKLTTARRSKLSVYELYTNEDLSQTVNLEHGRYMLNSLKQVTFKPSWQPDSQTLEFSIDSAPTTTAELVLDVRSAPELAKTSRLRVLLNGQSIGYTYLDKAKKRVRFALPAGQFKPTGNRLTFAPMLTPTEKTPCLHKPGAPLVNIGEHSVLRVNDNAPLPRSDLTVFAANGGPFANNTSIVMTAKSAKDISASLKFLAYAARQFGPRLANANYADSFDNAHVKTSNILVIGPHAFTNKTLSMAAPRTVKTALAGQAVNMNIGAVSKPQKQASLSSDLAFRLAARTSTRTVRIRSGGLASVFASPFTKGRYIGVFTTNTSTGFANAVKAITRPSHWNTMSGGVVRWNTSSLISTQNALTVTGAPVKVRKKTVSDSPLIAKLQNAWTGTQNKFAALFERTPKTRKSAQRTVQTTPKEHTKTSASIPSLRGASNPISYSQKPKMRPANFKLPQISQPKISVAELKQSMNINQINRSLEKKFSGLKHQGQKIVGRTEIPSFMPDWLKNVKSAQAMLLLLICLGAILILFFASPKANDIR